MEDVLSLFCEVGRREKGEWVIGVDTARRRIVIAAAARDYSARRAVESRLRDHRVRRAAVELKWM